ncbi:DUF6017 domain-containing protein [Oscillibacter ruminantium]
MAVVRVVKTSNYTVMSNYHLRDMNLSLRTKGLLSQMLSLPPEWDYSVMGLTKINREGKDAIRAALYELENAGYLIRTQAHDGQGYFGKNEYTIYETPQSPLSENPPTDNPPTVNPSSDRPLTDNPPQLSKDQTNTEQENKDGINYRFNSFRETQDEEAERLRRERNIYRSLILENIEYDILISGNKFIQEDLDEIVEIMLDAVCANKSMIRISGQDMPREVVKSRLLKLTSEHIQFVLDCMKNNTTKVRNIKQYLLTTLYNAPITISNYYGALVNHDLHGGGK